MDLRAYYKHIREVESTIAAPFVVIVGLETPEGGKPGVATEVSRFVAAKLIAEGRAVLAPEAAVKAFYDASAESRREAEASAAAQKMQVTIVGHTDLKSPKSGRGLKE